MKQQILINSAESFETYIYEDGAIIVPASATVTIYKPSDSNTILLDEVMNIASDGLSSATLTSGDNRELGENYKAVITYIFNGSTDKAVRFYDVVNARLVSVVTDSDVTGELPQLKGSGWKVMGTSESGSSTTIVDSELKNYPDDYFNGGTAYSIDKDELRAVTGFDSSTGTVTVNSFAGAITTDKYILTRSFKVEIGRAFEKIEESLSALGRRPSLVLDPYDLKEVHIYMSVSEACKGLSTDDSGFWWKMWKEYEEKGSKLFELMSFKYDATDDGVIGDGEEVSGFSTNRVGRR